MPCLGVDRLADTADHAQSAEVGVLDVRFTQTAKQTDGGWSSVEVGNTVPVDGLPEARWSRVCRSRLEDSGSNAVSERAVHQVAVRLMG